MKTTINIVKKIIFLILILFTLIRCDNNDDAPSSPQDGFTVNANFYETVNAYITVDQLDANNDGFPDHYNFFFTNGRITDTFGDAGIGYAYSYSVGTEKLAKFSVFASDNSSLTNGGIAAGNTYIASSLTNPNTGYAYSTIAYQLQTGTPIGTENGTSFAPIPEVIGIWHYVGTIGPSITINSINIDNNIPQNSTIDVDYTFQDTFGLVITGHYEGTLGIILD